MTNQFIDVVKGKRIGVLGLGRSNLALIRFLNQWDLDITACDRKSQQELGKTYEELNAMDIKLSLGEGYMDALDEFDIIFKTPAIPNHLPQLISARQRGTLITSEIELFMELCPAPVIGITGSDGKTTTTSMVATILNRSVLNPTILLGGKLDEIGGNVKLGNREYLLTEACEYKGNILKYFPTMAVILNMEEDHLDYFKDINHIVDTFVDYGKNIQDEGFLIINMDDVNAKKVIENTNANIIGFGINNKANYSAENISFSKEGYPNFMLNINGKSLYPVKLNVMGIHNVYNALASIAITHILGVPIEIILKAIADYKGTHRRLEIKGIVNGIKIIDDYAHHPTEIKASLKALRNSTQEKIWCIFQPHTYTRTKLLLNNFSTAFKDADKVIIPDIYAAREKNTNLIHSTDLVDALVKNGTDAIYISSFEDIGNYILENVKAGDIVVTMGAGNVYTIGDNLLESNEKKAI